MANRDGGSGSLATLVAGALIGAAGLGWWLLSEAERRRQQPRQNSNLRINRLGWSDEDEPVEAGTNRRPLPDTELQDKVHELNQAIEDVRRQLETMGTQS